MTRRFIIFLFVMLTTAALPARADDASRVRIDAGPLRGTVAATHRAFLGVPFAKPPLGPLRWRAPQPPDAWQGERDATRMPKACAQPLTSLAVAIHDYSEDCLYLNVYTPVQAREGGKLPVIVWIHGGATMTGAALEYDGAALAEVGGVIVVTINYRLGMLGFLALPELQAEDGRMNWGLQDQQEALRWVQRNIAHFGGDAGNVTIAGESAGGQSVMAHMVSPAARGLMHRAIVQSAAPTGLFNSPLMPTQAFELARQHVQGAGCAQARDRLACLRDVPVDKLVEAVPYSMDFRQPGGGMGPVLDGTLYPVQVFEGFKSNAFTRVPLLIGMTRDELQLLVALAYNLPLGRAPTEEEYQSSLLSFGTPPEAARFLTGFYPSSRHGSPQNALSALLTDFLFMCPNHRATRVLAAKVPTWAYRFDDREAPQIVPVPGVDLRAYHGAEVQYVLPMWQARPFTPAQQELATRMKKYWANFAATGDPNRGLDGVDKALPHWPRFNLATASYKVLKPGKGTEVLAFGALPRQHLCLLWDVVESLLPKAPSQP